MTLGRLMFPSDQEPLTSAQAVVSFSQAEDNLFFKQAVRPLLISITRVMDKDSETKPRRVGRRSSSLRNLRPHNPQQSPRQLAPLAFVMQISGRIPRRAALVGTLRSTE